MGREKFQMPRRAFLTGAASLSGTFALSQETGVFDAVEAEAEAQRQARRLCAISAVFECWIGGRILTR